jgi:hypothetical protein
MKALRTPADLRSRARRYRWMAKRIIDPRAIDALLEMATEYDELAQDLEDEQG